MTISEIKNEITSQPNDAALSQLIADSWAKAEIGLSGIVLSDYRTVAVMEDLLQMLCLAIDSKMDYSAMTSGDKELLVEKMKQIFEPIKTLLPDGTDFMLPSFTSLEALMPGDDDFDSFQSQLAKDFKALSADESDALAIALYGIVYAFFGNLDWDLEHCLKTYVGDAFDAAAFYRTIENEQQNPSAEPTGNVYTAPQTGAATTATAVPTYTRPRKMPGKWKPLKVYLIVTTLFVALVVGLVFFSMSSGVGSSAMSIMNTSGEMVSIEPGMQPVDLFLFGTVDYDGLLSGIQTAAIVFAVWRVLLITAVYIFNYNRRKKAAYQIP